MNRTAMLREVRMEAFERVHELWRRKRLVQRRAARLLKAERTDVPALGGPVRGGGSGRSAGDRRLGSSARRAPPEEVAAVEALYRTGHREWNVRHFYDEVYGAEGGGTRSYTWVKNRLQEAGLVKKGRRKGPHRERRERKATAGRMLHQDGSRHRWVADRWWDLVVTMDDAMGEVCSGFFVEEEGTWSSFRGVCETGGGEGAVRQPVHGSGPALLAHAEGGREGGRGQPAAAAPLPLRAGQGLRPRVRGRRCCGLPRDPEAGALRRRRPTAGQGRGGCVRASASLLG